MNFDSPLSLFQHLLALDEQGMANNLPTLIDKNHEFYDEVIALISAHEENIKQTSFNELISKQAEQLVEDNEIHELVGKQISVYKLVKKLGQGGMGAVYLGERNDGQLEQKVAIKFVYPSIAALAGDNFLNKEAQHLANLEHTNIAKIFNIGKTEEDLRYMVMEYVDGMPIDDYCESNNLDLTACLKLFQKVCSAVQFAHQNMVIHADIKPSNILVDKQGEPKLMDFGIARHIGLIENENLLGYEQKANYLNAVSRDYASPEQLAGKKISTMSDVYALGKNLEALFSSDLVIPNEIMAIISKSTDDDIKKRYSSPFELSGRVSRFINKQPISEYSNSLIYKTSKLLHRNKLVSGITLSLVITIALSSYSLYNSNKKLIEQVEVSEEVTAFLTDMFDASDIDKNSALTVEELIDNSSEKALKSVNKSSKVRAHLLKAIAKVYQGRGSLKKSEALYNRALPLFDKNDEAFYVAQNELAQVYMLSGRTNLAKKALESTISNGVTKKVIYEAFNLMGLASYNESKYANSRNYYFKALEGYKTTIPLDKFMLATIYGNIGVSYLMEGNNEEALPHVKEALKLDYEMYGQATHPRTALHLQQVGSVQGQLGDYKSGLSNLKKSLIMFNEIAPEGHPRVYAVYNNIATIYGRDLKQPEEALNYLSKSVQALTQQGLVNSMDGAVIFYNVASRNSDIGEYQTAIEWYKKSLNISESLGAKGFLRAKHLGGYGETLEKVGDTANALKYLNQAIIILKNTAPENSYLERFEKLAKQLAAS